MRAIYGIAGTLLTCTHMNLMKENSEAFTKHINTNIKFMIEEGQVEDSHSLMLTPSGIAMAT